jgi:hypothetical protein
MPIHDWTRAGVWAFHDFHHSWISQISRSLKHLVLPKGYYALVERHAGRSDQDLLALQGEHQEPAGPAPWRVEIPRKAGAEEDLSARLSLDPPRARLQVEGEMAFYRRKRATVVVRHVSNDRVVAMIEVVSPGNKSHQRAIDRFADIVAWLLDHGIHLLVLDLILPGPCDPQGIHGAIWDAIEGPGYIAPEDKRLTFASYESNMGFNSARGYRAYIEPLAVGDEVPEMALFLEPWGHVVLPLAQSYAEAVDSVPARWRQVIEAR